MVLLLPVFLLWSFQTVSRRLRRNRSIRLGQALESFLRQAGAVYLSADLYEIVKNQKGDIGKTGQQIQEAREGARARFDELKARIREDLAAV